MQQTAPSTERRGYPWSVWQSAIPEGMSVPEFNIIAKLDRSPLIRWNDDLWFMLRRREDGWRTVWAETDLVHRLIRAGYVYPALGNSDRLEITPEGRDYLRDLRKRLTEAFKAYDRRVP